MGVVFELLKILSTVLLLGLGWLYYWTALRPFARRFNKIPGKPCFHFLKEMFPDQRRKWGVRVQSNLPYLPLPGIHEYFGRMKKECGKYVKVWVAHQPYLILTDVNLIEKLLSNPSHTDKAETYKSSFPLVGNGLVNAPSEKWKRDRRLLLPSLRSSMFQGYVQQFNKHSNTLLHILLQLQGRGGRSEEHHCVLEHYARCTMDIIFESMLDVEFNLQKNPTSGYYEAFTTLWGLIEQKSIQPWLHSPTIYKLLGYLKIEQANMDVLRKAFSEQSIEEQMKEWKRKDVGDPTEGPSKLAHLLYFNREDPKDVFHQFLTIMAGGYDTTSIALLHATYFLSLYPEVQKKMREEVDVVMGGDVGRELSLEDLSSLKYTELVLKESMRMLTPTPFFGRRLGEDFPIDGTPLWVPAGSNVWIPVLHVHNDPEVWAHPDNFIPERFLPENSVGRSPYSFLSFAGGPRGCFGELSAGWDAYLKWINIFDPWAAPKYAMLMMKCVLAKVVAGFELSTKKGWEEVKSQIECGVLTHIHGGLPIALKQRESTR